MKPAVKEVVMALYAVDPEKEQVPSDAWLAAQISAIMITGQFPMTPKQQATIEKYYGEVATQAIAKFATRH